MTPLRRLVVAAVLLTGACGSGGGIALPTMATTRPPATSLPTTTVPTSTSAPSTTTTLPSTTTQATSTTIAVAYPQSALDYFVEIAFGPEFGGGSRVIRKWEMDVEIEVHGTPNADDLATLTDVVDDLNALIDTIEVRIVEAGGNVDLYFAPESEFSEIEPNYVPVNMGFFWVWWDGAGNIQQSRVLISTTGLTQIERNHVIREEITQQMGLMSDSHTYPDSMFQQSWTTTQAYSELDELLIEMLYLPRVEVGMGVAEALAAIAG